MAKVLVVEDEVICSYFISSSLEEVGHEVMTAIQETKAVVIGRSFRPDVLITDWVLQDRESYGGLKVAETLYAEDPKLKIIFVTGMDIDTVTEEAKRLASASMVLSKPVSIDVLISRISEICNTEPPQLSRCNAA